MRIPIEEKIKALEELTESECTCDMEHPWERCAGCKAANALNEAYTIIHNRYHELKLHMNL